MRTCFYSKGSWTRTPPPLLAVGRRGVLLVRILPREQSSLTGSVDQDVFGFFLSWTTPQNLGIIHWTFIGMSYQWLCGNNINAKTQIHQ